MKRRFLFLFAASILSSASYAQSLIKIQSAQDNFFFSTEEQMLLHPDNIAVKLDLQTSFGNKGEAVAHHIETRRTVFSKLDALGTSYQGESDEDIASEAGGGFLRNKRVTTNSDILVVVYSDQQLQQLAEVIDDFAELRLVEYEAVYAKLNSVEEIQKYVVKALLDESEKHQAENNIKLHPTGISQLNIESTNFGEKPLGKLLEDNEVPDDKALSVDSIEIVGVNHEVLAELSLRRVY